MTHPAPFSLPQPDATAASSPPIVVTQGDSAGIGPEIIVMAFRDYPQDMRGCFVAGDVATMRRAAQVIAHAGPQGGSGYCTLPVAVIEAVQHAWQVPQACVPVLALAGIPGPAPWGQVSAQAGLAAARSVQWAARAALQGQVAAIVTAPLHKAALHRAGVDFPGHTELLQAEAAAHCGVPVQEMPVRMMLASDELRTVLLSIHVSLREALQAVTHEAIVQTLHITHRALLPVLGRAPRIAVAGLNPHAGEDGRFGREEITTITPAIAAACAAGIDARGPYPPDTVFMRARHTPQRAGEFDVVLAMYHDQGLIPVKYLGLEHGVNVTLGLPLIRTSPDHGTAFDIAGRGVASAASLVQAVRTARAMLGLRARSQTG